jgi:FtsZ-binding cell division protein ZapB
MDTAAVQALPELPLDLNEDQPGLDPLASLEDRIRRAADLVSHLRAERDAAVAERDAARKAAGAAVTEQQKMRAELDSLRGERKQVRQRIEKLLGQMDLLSGS